MDPAILNKALERMGLDASILDRLARARAGDLQTVLMAAMRQRSLAQKPRDVLAAMERRFCRPGAVDPRAMRRVDGVLFDAAEGFELLELGPVAPLGSCSAVAPCDPHKILATVRNLEVTSDPSNVLALEAARRRRAGAPRVDLAASHRALRLQALTHPDHRAHFRLFVLVSMFPSRGSGREEAAALAAHLDVYRRLDRLAPAAGLERVSLSCREQPWRAVRDAVARHLGDHGIALDDADDRIGNNPYYQGLSFTAAFRTPAGRSLPLIDGGFTTWGAALTGRAKERTLISAIGSELLAHDL